jgi:serine/threonine protein kinase
LLKQLPPHPNIVGFRDAFWAGGCGSSARVLAIILEYADGGDLEQYLHSLDGPSLSEEQARHIFLQLVQALEHLHRHRVAHRDVKCGNVFLFRSGRVVLGDFGASKLLPASSGSDSEPEAQALASTVVGSPLYMSPEMLEGEPHGFATDIWSLGCVFYEMLSRGKPAFAAPSYPAVVYRITQGTFDPLSPTSVALEVRNLILSMLQRDPQKRPSIADVLQTPWLAAYGASPQREMKAARHNWGSDDEKQGWQDPATVRPTVDDGRVDSSFGVSTSKQTFMLPPPAPAIPSRSGKHPPVRYRVAADRARDPLIRVGCSLTWLVMEAANKSW